MGGGVLLVVPRSSDKRLFLVDHLTKRLSFLTDTDIVLNFVVMNPGGQSETIHAMDYT